MNYILDSFCEIIDHDIQDQPSSDFLMGCVRGLLMLLLFQDIDSHARHFEKVIMLLKISHS